MAERLRLGDMLVAAGMVSEAQVEEALGAQKELGLRLGETLVYLGHVTEPQMTQVVSNQLTIPWVNLYHVDFSRELLGLVPSAVAEKYRLIPVYVRHVRRQGDTLYVAMDNPLNVVALQEVADGSGLPVKPMVASPTDIRNAIRVYYLGLPPLEDEAPPEGVIELKTKKKGVSAPRKIKGKTAKVEKTAAQEKIAEKPVAEKPRAEEPSEKPRTEPVAKNPRAEKPVAIDPRGEESVAEKPVAEKPKAQERPEDDEPEERPAVKPSVPPGPRPGPGFMTLMLLDGTRVRLPSAGSKKKEKAEERLTTRDLIHALHARASGADVGDILPEDAWEPLFASLLSVLLRKGLIADWEFVDEWNKQRSESE